MESKKQINLANSRPTIGLLLSDLLGKNAYDIWRAVNDVGREHQVNIISLMTNHFESPFGFDRQANVLYDLAGPDSVDGVIIWTSIATHYVDLAGAQSLFDRYHSLPIVAIEGGPAGIPQVNPDFYQSMREEIIHLIEHHGYHRIAFIRGPDITQATTYARYQAYLDVLEEYGLPFDPNLVTPPSEYGWTRTVGETAIAMLLDQRQVDFEAIIAASDSIALGAMQALQTRGIHIPKQVAIVAFDDEEYSEYVTPPLTTVALKTYEQGRRAAEMLLTLIEGGEVPAEVNVPLKLIIRESCGCTNAAVAEVTVVSETAGKQSLETLISTQRNWLLDEMKRAAETTIRDLDPNWGERLLSAFVADLTETPTGTFLQELETNLHLVIAGGGRAVVWQNVITILRRYFLPALDNNPLLARAEQLWLQAQILIGDIAQRNQGYLALQTGQLNRILNEIGSALLTTFDVEGLMDVLAKELPRLGIPSCYLSLYEDPQQPAGRSKLILAYNEHGRLEIEPEWQTFPSTYLVPPQVLPPDRPYNLIIEALYFRDKKLGLLIFEEGPPQSLIYDALREQISSALQGALLVQQVQNNTAEIARQKYILDSFMENVPDSIYFKDCDSRLIQVNHAYVDHFGYNDPAELMGKTDFDLFPDKPARVKFEQEQEIIRTGHPQLGMEEPGGTPGHWVLTSKMPLRDEHGQIIGTFGISRDITPLKQAQHILAQQARQLQTVAEVATAASTILDTNELLQKVVDLTRIRFELYHAHIYLLNETEDMLELKAGAGEKGRKMVKQGWSIPLVSGKSLVARAARHRRGEIVNDVQANPHWLPNPLLPNTRSELAVPLIVGDQLLGVLDVQADEVDYFTEEDVHIQGTLAAQVAVAIKNAQLYHQEAERVHELAKLNSDLEAAQTELLRRERLATLGQLTAVVSHEIRNPLATIRTSAFAVDRKIRNKGLGLEPALDRIQRNITRCDNIIAELLDYTRMHDLKPQPIAFDDWLMQVLDELTLPKNITLGIDLAAGVKVPLDPERFRRVIINLVDNAYQAMLEYEARDDNLSVLDIKSDVVNQQLRLSLADTGLGIPPEIMPHIFEPLYSTKGFGVGLGLSIVREIVKQHGGEIEITSTIGQGTQVTLWLPLLGSE